VITLTYIGTDGLVLNQNYPNPFNASTFISFTLPNQTNVKLEILDVYGNVINTLVNEELNSNNHRIVWNGTDANGNIAPSGTYMYRLITSEETAIGKMTLVR
jgi:flagellar hook assembly protein FlgD